MAAPTEAATGPVAYVHIGLGKTGTSTVQRSLTENRETLADLGIAVPGAGHRDTRRAVYDLMGRRIGGAGPRANAAVTGAWAPFAASIVASPAPAVVISEEMLALARPKQVRRLVDSLAPRRVVVIVTVRDLGRTLGSFWQQMLMMGRTETLPEFLAAVRDPAAGAASAGIGFWMRQDLVRVLTAWESAVPRADLRVVTVPAAGQPPELLNDRFASVIGAPAGLLRSSRARGNASVGVTEAEVVRRLNERLGDAITEKRRLAVMQTVRLSLNERETVPITVPESEAGWVTERAHEMTRHLAEGGYQVVGDLADLEPRFGPGLPEEVPDAELADATFDALAALAVHEVNRKPRRRAGRARRAHPPAGRAHSRAELASSGRATLFRLKTWALAKADDNRLLGWAARTYLKRSSGR